MVRPPRWAQVHEFAHLHGRLGEIVARSRTEAGLSQVDLARILRRPQSFISKLEAMQRRIGAVELLQIARALGREPDDMMRELAAAVGPNDQEPARPIVTSRKVAEDSGNDPAAAVENAGVTPVHAKPLVALGLEAVRTGGPRRRRTPEQPSFPPSRQPSHSRLGRLGADETRDAAGEAGLAPSPKIGDRRP